MTDVQRLYGLVVASEFELHQARAVPAGTPADVVVRWGETRATHRTVDGEVLLEVGSRRRVDYSITEQPDGDLVLRFTGACDFEVSADLADVVVHPIAGADPGIAVVLTTGAMLAFQLYRRGLAVLHASAVDVGGAALAFVGASGGGKSTMATLMCADGARLITDDVLRLDGADPPVARLGATGLRLRKGADSLVGLFNDEGPGRRLSADDRHVLSPRADAPDRLPLAAIVLPMPDRRLHRLTVVRREPKDALFDLLSYPRLPGWRDPRVLRAHLAHLAGIVAHVPVYQAQVPWGPPFAPTLAAELRAAIPELEPGARGSYAMDPDGAAGRRQSVSSGK